MEMSMNCVLKNVGMKGKKNDLLPKLMNLKKTEAQVNLVLNLGFDSKSLALFK